MLTIVENSDTFSTKVENNDIFPTKVENSDTFLTKIEQHFSQRFWKQFVNDMSCCSAIDVGAEMFQLQGLDRVVETVATYAGGEVSLEDSRHCSVVGGSIL